MKPRAVAPMKESLVAARSIAVCAADVDSTVPTLTSVDAMMAFVTTFCWSCSSSAAGSGLRVKTFAGLSGVRTPHKASVSVTPWRFPGLKALKRGLLRM